MISVIFMMGGRGVNISIALNVFFVSGAHVKISFIVMNVNVVCQVTKKTTTLVPRANSKETAQFVWKICMIH